MKTIAEIMEEHEAEMVRIRNRDRESTFNLCQINTLSIYEHGIATASLVSGVKKALLKKVVGEALS